MVKFLIGYFNFKSLTLSLGTERYSTSSSYDMLYMRSRPPRRGILSLRIQTQKNPMQGVSQSTEEEIEQTERRNSSERESPYHSQGWYQPNLLEWQYDFRIEKILSHDQEFRAC